MVFFCKVILYTFLAILQVIFGVICISILKPDMIMKLIYYIQVSKYSDMIMQLIQIVSEFVTNKHIQLLEFIASNQFNLETLNQSYDIINSHFIKSNSTIACNYAFIDNISEFFVQNNLILCIILTSIIYIIVIY